MNCPYCNTPNAITNRFCLRCGQPLPEPQPAVRQAANSHSSIALTAAAAAAIGGALSALGWFTPWVGFGALLSNLINPTFGRGGLGSLLNLGTGVGNGLQITLGMLVASFAAFTDSNWGWLGLFGLLVVGVMVAIAVCTVMNIQAGLKLFELRLTSANSGSAYAIGRHLHGVKGRSSSVLVLLAAIFILLAAIPFGTAAIGSGFYLTALGFMVSYLGARIMASQMHS